MTKQMPSSLGVEQTVLGSMLIDRDACESGMELLSKECFYSDRNKKVFSAILLVARSGGDADLITVSNGLRDAGETILGGTEVYLTELTERVVTTRNIEHHAKKLDGLRRLRELIHISDDLQNACFENAADADQLVDLAESKIFGVTKRVDTSRWYSTEEIVPEIFSHMDRVRSTGKPVGLASGFTLLDKQTTGFQKGDLIIVAGRPGMGKTSFGLSAALNVCRREKDACVALFSMEMSKSQIVERAICNEVGVSIKQLRDPYTAKAEHERIMASSQRVRNMLIEVDDTGLLTPMQQRAKLRRLVKTRNVVMVIGDYIQLMHDSEKHQNRQSEVGAISRSLKLIAREFDIPYMAISQLSRGVKSRPKNERRPVLSDLRDSGAIEQDADMVLFCYLDEKYNATTKDKGIAEIIIGKQRNGPTGTIRLSFAGERMRFDNLEEQLDGFDEPPTADDYEDWRD